jgi:hypothetical protein
MLIRYSSREMENALKISGGRMLIRAEALALADAKAMS